MAKVTAKLIVKDRGWAAMLKRVEDIKNSYVKVGVLGDDPQGGGMHETEPDGSASPLTVGEIAAIMEFGTQDGHIPARSFARSTFDEKREQLVDLGKKLIGGVVDGKVTVQNALNMMGSTLANAMKRKITDGEGIPPPNAPSTIAAKGSSRPLVNTGRLLNSITWAAVINGKGGGEEGSE